MNKTKVVEFLDHGVSIFGEWFSDLDPQAAAKVATALYRLEQGNFSNVKSVGHGVSEYRIDFGPEYRIYLGLDGNTLVILLEGAPRRLRTRI